MSEENEKLSVYQVRCFVTQIDGAKVWFDEHCVTISPERALEMVVKRLSM